MGFALLVFATPAFAASLTDELAGIGELVRRYANAALQQALEKSPTNEASFWSSAASGVAGVVTPRRTYRTTSGYYCRVYTERVITADSRRIERTATACRDDGGVWRDLPVD